jgi:hypothetical protein
MYTVFWEYVHEILAKISRKGFMFSQVLQMRSVKMFNDVDDECINGDKDRLI